VRKREKGNFKLYYYIKPSPVGTDKDTVNYLRSSIGFLILFYLSLRINGYNKIKFKMLNSYKLLFFTKNPTTTISDSVFNSITNLTITDCTLIGGSLLAIGLGIYYYPAICGGSG
jgi:hypothetical protein